MSFPNILVKKQMNIGIPQNKCTGIEMLINFLCQLLPEILLNDGASIYCEKNKWNAWVSTQAFSAPISSLSVLLVHTQAARWKAATPEQLTGAKLYLDKSDFLFHAFANVMIIIGTTMKNIGKMIYLNRQQFTTLCFTLTDHQVYCMYLW